MIWKQIPFAPDYDLSECGKVRLRTDKGYRWKKGSVLKGALHSALGYDGSRYRVYVLTVDGKKKFFYAHRLVARVYLGEAPLGSGVVAHYDGNRQNNHYTNLRWTDHKGNGSDFARHDRRKGSLHPRSKLTEKSVLRARHEYRVIGRSYEEIAKELGVHRDTVYSAINGINWGHV